MKIENISKARSELMGFSMLIIMFFHTTNKLPHTLDLVKNFGDFGVNIFFLVSGFSMYFAWMKKPEIKYFLTKRISRIAFTFLPIAIVWCLISVAMHECGVIEAICKILTIQFWINGNLLHWFVSGIIVCYILTPFWIRLAQKSKMTCLILTVLICIVLFCLSILPVLRYIRCFIQRFPTYFFGLYLGKNYYEKKELNSIQKVGIVLLLIVSLILFGGIGFDTLNYEWKYLIYLLLTIPVTFLLALLFTKVKNTFISNFLVFCGSITLEYYLLQEKILKILTIIMKKVNISFDEDLLVINLIVIILTFICAYGYHLIIDTIVNKKRSSQ